MRHKFSLSLGFSSCLRGSVNSAAHACWTCHLALQVYCTISDISVCRVRVALSQASTSSSLQSRGSSSKLLQVPASRDLSQAVLLHTSTVLKMVQSLLICWPMNKFERLRGERTSDGRETSRLYFRQRSKCSASTPRPGFSGCANVRTVHMQLIACCMFGAQWLWELVASSYERPRRQTAFGHKRSTHAACLRSLSLDELSVPSTSAQPLHSKRDCDTNGVNSSYHCAPSCC